MIYKQKNIILLMSHEGPLLLILQDRQNPLSIIGNDSYDIHGINNLLINRYSLLVRVQ